MLVSNKTVLWPSVFFRTFEHFAITLAIYDHIEMSYYEYQVLYVVQSVFICSTSFTSEVSLKTRETSFYWLIWSHKAFESRYARFIAAHLLIKNLNLKAWSELRSMQSFNLDLIWILGYLFSSMELQMALHFFTEDSTFRQFSIPNWICIPVSFNQTSSK